jgi:hypothetical protein
MSREILLFAAAYLLIGAVVLWRGPWSERITSLVRELTILSLLSEADEMEGGDESEARRSRTLRWRVKAAGVLLWTAALAVWPFSLWSWGRKRWYAWKKSRERDRKLWRIKGKVSTCPPKLSVSFRERWGQTAAVGFEADDALNALEGFVTANPHLLEGEHGEALQWLKHRDKKSDREGYCRSKWRPIETTAIELMKSGRCKVKCCACDHLYDGTEIKFEPWESWIPASDSFNGGGAAGEDFTTPKGHLLFENTTAMA